MIVEIEGRSMDISNYTSRSIYYIDIDNISMVEKRMIDNIKYIYSIHVGNKTIIGISNEDGEKVLSLQKGISRDKQIDSILNDKE